MASVSNLDQDLRGLRLSRYTPSAANEVRKWIEGVLHEQLPPGDLLDVLKDGTILCRLPRLVNLAVPPGLKFRKSAMPFVQMENISQFLKACQTPPLSLKEHDVFLTVDLYEGKDPAQVLQCLSAFSRRAHALAPAKFPNPIGPKTISPQNTGSSAGSGAVGFKKPAPVKPPKPVSTWSKPEEETVTQPAWNIHQYGYMGGANQANMGINFGVRRGITTYADGPKPLTLAEKEARRKAEAEQHRTEAEQREQQRQAELEAEEARAREEEEQLWQEETRKLHEKERREAEQEKARWAAEQRAWEEEEERKRQQHQQNDVERRMDATRQHARQSSDARLNGQFLSQYQAASQPASPSSSSRTVTEGQRVRELERQLAEAKEREREYEQARQQELDYEVRMKKQRGDQNAPPALPARATPHKPSYQIGSQEEERLALKGAWKAQHEKANANAATTAAAEDDDVAPAMPPRPLPVPGQAPINHTSTSFTQTTNRTDRFLNNTPAPSTSRPNVYRPPEFSTTQKSTPRTRGASRLRRKLAPAGGRRSPFLSARWRTSARGRGSGRRSRSGLGRL
ncbi:hypothetical protein KEM56_003465 [Ascosphaera pollenicola]|nr:hypothetical protein KEM56_003465 [Ascosphaera pollenicola]